MGSYHSKGGSGADLDFNLFLLVFLAGPLKKNQASSRYPLLLSHIDFVWFSYLCLFWPPWKRYQAMHSIAHLLNINLDTKYLGATSTNRSINQWHGQVVQAI